MESETRASLTDQQGQTRKQFREWLEGVVLPRVRAHHQDDPTGETHDLLEALDGALTWLDSHV
jgi:hypothetical protein